MKRALFLFLACVFCLSLISCAKEEAVTTETVEEVRNTTEEAEKKPSIPSEKEREEEINKAELIDEVISYAGFSDTGTLKDAGLCDYKFITAKSDLDPYRSALSGLTAEEEKKMLEDKKGCILLIEVSAPNAATYCGISSVFRSGGTIEITVQEGVDEAVEQPAYSFFLLYFPDELYNQEGFSVFFV